MDWRNRMAPFSGQTIVLLALTTIANIYFDAKTPFFVFWTYLYNKSGLSRILFADYTYGLLWSNGPFSGETIVLLALTTIANIIFKSHKFTKIREK